MIGVGSVFVLLNWYAVVHTWFTGRYSSCVPLFGAALLGGGMLLRSDTRPYSWAALVVDVGTLQLLAVLPRILREFWGTSRINLLEEYVARRGAKTVCLRLFRKGIFTLRLHIDRPPGEFGLTGASTIGTWDRERDRLVLRRWDGPSAEFAMLPGAEREGIRQVAGFADYEGGPELSLADIELKLQFKRT